MKKETRLKISKSKKGCIPWNKGNKLLNPKYNKICPECKCNFKSYSTKFCSRECTNINLSKRYKNKRISVNCDNCNKDILIKPSRYELYKLHFCNKECQDTGYKNRWNGKDNFKWKNGKIIRSGYIIIYAPQHKYNVKKYVPEHRLVVEEFIGRYLDPKEVIHHINEIKSDNRIENLMIFPTNSSHIKFHMKIRQFGVTNPIRREIENRWDKYIKTKDFSVDKLDLSDFK